MAVGVACSDMPVSLSQVWAALLGTSLTPMTRDDWERIVRAALKEWSGDYSINSVEFVPDADLWLATLRARQSHLTEALFSFSYWPMSWPPGPEIWPLAQGGDHPR